MENIGQLNVHGGEGGKKTKFALDPKHIWGHHIHPLNV